MLSRLSLSDRLVLISNLRIMLEAGIPILEVIDSIQEDAKGIQKKILQTLESDLKQGQSIAATLSKFPNSFDPIFINLIKAGEKSGTLDAVLKSLEETTKKEIEFNSKIKAALAYPLLVMFVFSVVILIILTFVLPKVTQVFLKLKVDLPMPTKILIYSSNFVIQFLPLIIISIFIAIFLFFLLYKSKRKVFLNVFYSLPILSRLGKFIDLTRFCRSLALMLESGIPITEALELSSKVVVQTKIVKAVNKSKQAIAQGQRLSAGLKENKGAIPPIMLRLISAGEKSGRLDNSLYQVADYFDDQTSTILKILTDLLEPILLVIIGIFVGGTMLAIIAPIYQLIGQIKPR